MAPTPSKSNFTTPKSNHHQAQSRNNTPQSSKQHHHRLNFNMSKPSPNPNSVLKENQPPPDHPVEVIGRIRDYPDRKDKLVSALQVNQDRQSLRVRTDIGYRDFSFDGVSLSEEEDLDRFYKKFVESRINGVKLGDKCTIMMYGPTGSGKSHTMFGCSKQPGIVYRSLKGILGNGEEENSETDDDQKASVGTFVQVTVLEIYNEEIYDLLSTSGGGGFSLGWSKGSASKVKLEVMGKKAKNATYISGTEAGKISKEIQKVEKRRIVKSTLCNERSSRSHCMIILDVPTVGGRLMLVDMAGSENIEQAGQIGLEAKMQTGKINQGNIALKRVVESIANGDSHVPFRDSKLTMLLQDSFEDDKSKILMILCASPDPKEMHKTISTLEYGAKAKCIVRGPHTPNKEKGAEDSSSAVVLGSRIAAMDQFIYKLQMENKVREKERNEANKKLMKKEEEISALRSKLAQAEGRGTGGASEEEINLKVNERTKMLRSELEKKVQECQKMANDILEMERRKMEEKILQQQQELEMLRRRLEEIETELCRSRDGNDVSSDMEGSNFAKRLLSIYADEDPGMEKSMDLDKSLDMDMGKREGLVNKTDSNSIHAILGYPQLSSFKSEECRDVFAAPSASKAYLTTVYEEEEEEEKEGREAVDEEVQKEVIEEKIVCSSRQPTDNSNSGFEFHTGSFVPSLDFLRTPDIHSRQTQESEDDTASSRQLRIQNIFTLCGNYRELSMHSSTSIPNKRRNESPSESPVKTTFERNSSEKGAEKCRSGTMTTILQDSDEISLDSKENYDPQSEKQDSIEVFVKWEASKENPGKIITTLKVVKDATLADLRKLIEIYLGADNQAFTFLELGDPTGAPVPKEKEASVQASKLPICNNQRQSHHLACLRPATGVSAITNHTPLSSLDNKLPLTPISNFQKGEELYSPKVTPMPLSSTPFITRRRGC